MTVSSQTNSALYVGNGVTTLFPIPFRYFENGDIHVYLINPVSGAATSLTLGVDYSLTGAGDPEMNGAATGTLTTTVAVPNLTGLYFERVLDLEQNTDIINQGQFFAETHEDVFDRLTMLLQQINANSQGAIRVSIGEPEVNRLPPPAGRADLLLSFDSDGNPIMVAPANGSAASLAQDLANTSIMSKGAAMIGRGVQVTDSIAGLRALLKSQPSKSAFVTGYYAAFDGGGGLYRLDEADLVSADNGGSLIVGADGGRWKLLEDHTLSVKQFGAKGDGLTNDISAMNAAAAAASGRKVWVPAGNYRTGSAWLLPSNAVIEGAEGAKLTLLNATDASLIVNSNGAGGNSNISISNLELDGNLAGQGAISRPGMLFKNCTGVTLREVKVHDCKITTYGVDTYDQILFVDCFDCEMVRCESYNQPVAGGLGFYGTGGRHRLAYNYIHDCEAGIEGAYQTDSMLERNRVVNTGLALISWSGVNNTIQDNLLTDSSSGAGIVCGHTGIGGGPDQVANGSYVLNNIISDVFSYGVTVFASSNVTVEGNKITRVAGDSSHNIFINTGCSQVYVRKNAIRDYQTTAGGASGVFADGCSDLEVTDNYIYGAKGGTTGTGVRLFNACPNSKISGNTIVDTTGNGINISEASSLNCIIADNSIRTSGGVGIRSAAVGTVIDGNNVTATAGSQGILVTADQAAVVGNRVSGVTGASSVGILINATDYSVLAANSVDNCSTGISAPTNADNNLIVSNIFTATVTTKVSNAGTGNKIAHNMGIATHDV